MKEDLFKQGDQLEALIIKAETELRALENTVQILKWKNTDVKKTFDKLKESSKHQLALHNRDGHPVIGSEICDMNELAEHLRAVTEQVKIRRKQLKDLTVKNPAEQHASHIQLLNDVERLNHLVVHKHQLQAKLEDELEQYEVKINRAEQSVRRAYSSTCRSTAARSLRREDTSDIDVCLQHDTNQKIEHQLINLCASIGDEQLINTFEQLAEQHGHRMIVRPRSTPPKSSRISTAARVAHISLDGIS